MASTTPSPSPSAVRQRLWAKSRWAFLVEEELETRVGDLSPLKTKSVRWADHLNHNNDDDDDKQSHDSDKLHHDKQYHDEQHHDGGKKTHEEQYHDDDGKQHHDDDGKQYHDDDDKHFHDELHHDELHHGEQHGDDGKLHHGDDDEQYYDDAMYHNDNDDEYSLAMNEWRNHIVVILNDNRRTYDGVDGIIAKFGRVLLTTVERLGVATDDAIWRVATVLTDEVQYISCGNFPEDEQEQANCFISLAGTVISFPASTGKVENEGMEQLVNTGKVKNEGMEQTTEVFRIIRLLRILRIFRIVKFLRQLYMLAFGFALAAVAVFWVTILMFFVLYVCSVILVKTVGHTSDDDPHAEFLREKFGCIIRAMLTLFEIMSAPTLEEYEAVMWERPCLAMFIIVFIIFGSFGMIALLTGVISESMFDKNNLRMEEERMERENMRKMLIRTCENLFDELPSQSISPKREEGAHVWEVQELLPRIATLFESKGVAYAGEDLFAMLDILNQEDGTITRDEFKFFIVQLAEGVRPLLIMRLFYAVSGISKQSDEILDSITRMREAQRQAALFGMPSEASNLGFASSSSEDCRQILQRLDRLGNSVEGMGVRMENLNGKVEDMNTRMDDNFPRPQDGLGKPRAKSKAAGTPTLARRLSGVMGVASSRAP